MPRPPTCSLAGVAYSLGECRAVGRLREASIAEADIAQMVRWGMRNYAASQLSAAELARTSIVSTLERAAVQPKDIQAVVYATSYLDEQQFYDIHGMLSELGIQSATPIAVSLGGCGNVAAALRVASSLVVAEGAACILVVTVEKCPEASRVLPEGECVLSDGAATAIVSGPGRGEFDVESICMRAQTQLAGRRPSAADAAQWSLAMMAGLRATVRELCERTELRPAAFSRFICNNYSERVILPLVALCGFSPAQAYVTNIPRVGHAFSADVLINLRDLQDEGGVERSHPLVLASTSNGAWSAIALRSTQPSRKDTKCLSSTTATTGASSPIT